MATVKLVIKNKATKKDGTTPIYLQYCYDSEIRTLINTGEFIEPKHWNFEKDIVRKSYEDFENLNGKLENKLNKLKNLILEAKNEGVDPTLDYIRNKYNNPIAETSLEVIKQLEQFIIERKGLVSGDTIKDYNSLKKHLINYEESRENLVITFKSFNKEFYNDFIKYLRFEVIKPDDTKGLKENTIGKQIKNLKIFLKDRMEQGIIPKIELKPFKTITEETDAIYLNEDELKSIYKLDYSDNKFLDEIRDLLIFGCFTGLRYSDLNRLQPGHFDRVNEVIQIKQTKVQRNVIIPFIDYVPEILKKYNYNLPKIHLNDFNREIKKICKKADINEMIILSWKKGPDEQEEKVFKKWELASSHVCRRSFCTNMYLSGMPAEELMKISGHKSAAAFRRYIKVDNLQAANRLKELRNKIKAKTKAKAKTKIVA